MATAVLPIPVGPKTAMTCTAAQYRHPGMSVRIGTGLSTLLEPRAAALDAATAAAAELGDERCDLVVVSAWAASLRDGTALTFHAAVEELEIGTGALTGMADLTGAGGAILIADPETFPTAPVLRFLSESTPMLPLIGGLASGKSLENETVLFIDERVVTDGAVGVRLDGVEMLPTVSQGAAPIGPELT